MSISQTQCTSFKAELYQGVHNLLADNIKMALYTSSADIGADTTVYITANEVSGTGYLAGGISITGVTVNTSGSIAYVNFDNVAWGIMNVTTRGALLYNASKSNKAIAVLDFGADKIATTGFTVEMPANTSTSALIRSN